MAAVSGYAGGAADTARYEMVGRGTTGHAEAVKITFDPRQVSYGQILRVYFSVAHDPTQLNRQGPDDGTQYRSEIFFMSPEQQRIAMAYIDPAHASAGTALSVDLKGRMNPATVVKMPFYKRPS